MKAPRGLAGAAFLYGGRPVDIAQLPDGSMLISHDFAERIYRVSYQAPVVNSAAPAVPK